MIPSSARSWLFRVRILGGVEKIIFTDALKHEKHSGEVAGVLNKMCPLGRDRIGLVTPIRAKSLALQPSSRAKASSASRRSGEIATSNRFVMRAEYGHHTVPQRAAKPMRSRKITGGRDRNGHQCEQIGSDKLSASSRIAVRIATSENQAYISTMAADKRPTGTHNPNQNSLQRWATEGGAEKGVHQKSPRAARAKKKQPAKAAKKK